MASVDDDLLPPTTRFPLLPEPESDEDETPETAPAANAAPTFDPRHREPFLGLLYLGELQKDFKLYGHTFTIKTPNQLAKIQAGLTHKKYLDSVSQDIAWAAIQVAIYLQEVDGSPLPEAISPRDSGIDEKLYWVLTNLKDKVIHQIFEECLILANEAEVALEELRRTSGELSG